MRGEEPNVDDVDRHLIRILQVDGRTPYSQLAKAVGLSDAAARQRVNRLREQGYINIVAITDPVTMGLGDHQGLLGLRVTSDASKVANEVGAFNDAVYVVMTAGRFDVIAEIVTRSRDEFLKLSNTVRALDGVEAVEILPYLGISKEAYNWGMQ